MNNERISRSSGNEYKRTDASNDKKKETECEEVSLVFEWRALIPLDGVSNDTSVGERKDPYDGCDDDEKRSDNLPIGTMRDLSPSNQGFHRRRWKSWNGLRDGNLVES